MAPPGSVWSEEQNERWIGGYEQITMTGTKFDNFIQDDSQMQWSGLGIGRQNPDFYEFVNGVNTLPNANYMSSQGLFEPETETRS